MIGCALIAPAAAQPVGLPLPRRSPALDAVRRGAVRLRQGSRGIPVVALQRLLTRAGHPLTDDGVFGPGTRAAVLAFQRAHGLTADGIVGPDTIRALDRAVGRASPRTRAPTPPAASPTPRGPRATRNTLRIPRRPANAPGGSALYAQTAGLTTGQREQRLLAELERGNLPSFLRRLQPVTLTGRAADGANHTIRVWVTPDYLAVGSDADFVRTPLTPGSAQRIADRFGCVLPTPKLVDAIYRQASVHLTPSPLPPGPAMTTNAYAVRHQQRVEQQWGALGGAARGALTAGHKKDVVVGNRQLSHPGRVAIYGWHRPNGRPIQPLTTVHGNGYADYSHGIRLVSAVAEVDGRPMALADVARDPALWPLVSKDGPIRSLRVPGVPAAQPQNHAGIVSRLPR